MRSPGPTTLTPDDDESLFPHQPLIGLSADRRPVQAGFVGLRPGRGDGDDQVGRHRRLGCERRDGLQLRVFQWAEPGGFRTDNWGKCKKHQGDQLRELRELQAHERVLRGHICVFVYVSEGHRATHR